MDEYHRKLPRQPDEATGHIYPYNFHGIAIFETHAQKVLVEALEFSAIFLFMSGVAIAIFKLKLPLDQKRTMY